MEESFIFGVSCEFGLNTKYLPKEVFCIVPALQA
jgi:hypothetical protein